MKESSGNIICGFCGEDMLSFPDIYGLLTVYCPQGRAINGCNHKHGISYGDLPRLPICETCFSPLLLVTNAHRHPVSPYNYLSDKNKHWYFPICSNFKCPDYSMEFFSGDNKAIEFCRIDYRNNHYFDWTIYNSICVRHLNVDDWLDPELFSFKFINQSILNIISTL